MESDQSSNTNTAPRHHQRSKSSVIKSFIHRRTNTEGSTGPSVPPALNLFSQVLYPGESILNAHEMPLGEIQQNQADAPARSPRKSRDEMRQSFKIPIVTNGGFTSTMKKSKTKEGDSQVKPKKTKSATNLAGILSKPKSFKNLKKTNHSEDEKNKENYTPAGDAGESLLPIFAQFSNGPLANTDDIFANPQFPGLKQFGSGRGGRPLSYQSPQKSHDKFDMPRPSFVFGDGNGRVSLDFGGCNPMTQEPLSGSHRPHRGSRPISIAHPPPRTQSKSDLGNTKSNEPYIHPKDIDAHLEAMLDRRNIPENQRYKMRNLTDTVKMEFIRQDWAEAAAAAKSSGTENRDTSFGSHNSSEKGSTKEGKKPSKTKSALTLSRPKKPSKDLTSASPTKRGGMGTLGRHFRSKSSESVTTIGNRPESAGSGGSSKHGSSSAAGFFAMVTGRRENTAADYVSYLDKTPNPEIVEVGRLHKLRLLLRNETVAWTENFIRQGGMKQIVGLLHRIMEVEWREEHEDALLHETLLCLKALCTVDLGLQYLHEIQETLFPGLLQMLFDPEKKGPSEFTTRGIITSVLFTYIETGPNTLDRESRARLVLRYLRDPEPAESDRPVDFVLEMRKERPYRVWCKEVVSVTKEVFWIFLHNLNVVSLPGEGNYKGTLDPAATSLSTDGPGISTYGDAHSQFMSAHFPKERPPVPAAPYVGGVEWDATNYIASHLDLMNAIIACTPTAAERNILREQLRVSGFERCLGGSLRLCKEKFYGSVHDGLRTWVAAAHADAWDIRDVRFGPPPLEKSRARSQSPAKKAKKDVEPPRLDMPRLDFNLAGSRPAGEMVRENHPWGL